MLKGGPHNDSKTNVCVSGIGYMFLSSLPIITSARLFPIKRPSRGRVSSNKSDYIPPGHDGYIFNLSFFHIQELNSPAFDRVSL